MSYDNSQLQTFKNCPESYRLKYRYEKDPATGMYLGLTKPDATKDDHHKDFGSAIHGGLKEFYLKKGWKEIEEAFDKEYPAQLDASDKAKTPENGKSLLKRYIKRYQTQDSSWEILDVEVSQEFELYPGVPFTVKIDLVVRQQGNIYFIDHKTTKMDGGIDSGYWTGFEPNSQITAYTAFCIERYGSCAGGIINALGLGFRTKPELIDPEDIHKTWMIYDVQELKFSKYHGKDMMYASGFKCDFQRNIFNRNQSQVDAWREDTLRWIDKMKAEEYAFEVAKGLLSPMAPGPRRMSIHQWTKNEGACRFCNFKEICINVGDEQTIEAMYVKENPLEYLDQ